MEVQQIASILRSAERRGKFRPILRRRAIRWRKYSWEGRPSPTGGRKTRGRRRTSRCRRNCRIRRTGARRGPARWPGGRSGRCRDGAAPCPTAASLPSRKAGLHKGMSSVGRDVLTGCAKLNGRDGNLLGECSLSFFSQCIIFCISKCYHIFAQDSACFAESG